MPSVRAYLQVPSGARIGNRRATCGRCSSWARYSGLGGDWCAGCWGGRKAAVRESVRLLSEGYGIDEDTLTMALAGEYGYCDLRPGQYGESNLRYHVDPARLARYVVHGRGEKSRLDAYQLQLVCRVLWAMALRAGIDLSDFPRGEHYPHPEIPWNLVDWAEQSAWHFSWMARYARALDAEYRLRWGKQHSAGEWCLWLAERVRGCRLAYLHTRPLPPAGAVCVDLDSAQWRAA
jgi:hypothetical protein